MAADDDSSELSSLASLSPVPSDDDLDPPSDLEPVGAKKKGILQYFPKLSEHPPKQASPPPRKREPSPPHEYVLADNPDIAVCRSAATIAHAKRLLAFCFVPISYGCVALRQSRRATRFVASFATNLLLTSRSSL
jgi:hypothetical protein